MAALPADNISPEYRYAPQDRCLALGLLKHEGSPEAIKYFAANSRHVTDYGYWFMLGHCWVSYSGFSNLDLWKRLFSSPRPRREVSLMKPDELFVYQNMPPVVNLLRAHRPGEQDWIAYTADVEVAGRFAHERQVRTIALYEVNKEDVTAFFSRRGEKEFIVLDKTRARFVRDVEVRYQSEMGPGEKDAQAGKGE